MQILLALSVFKKCVLVALVRSQIYGEKPELWKESGKRVKRGLYRTAKNILINADCNGAANIARKVAATLGLDLDGVSRGALTTPLKFNLWTIQESQPLQL